LDTHVWFWYLIGSERLPVGIREAIDAAPEACWISPISVWELSLLAERGRIRLQGKLRGWMAAARERFPVKEAALNVEVALRSREIELPHRDPADHFLAATALVYELTLMTVDEHLTGAQWLPTRSA
jgi:PIN domain nuclease of toxin-antitoxin system